MRFVKLDAIDSTNDFLKELVRSGSVENYTVVTARSQTRGKGQMGAEWISEAGKNLTMSMLVADADAAVASIFKRNAAVAIAITDVLHGVNIPAVSVKWPNDIMSGNKKIGGILIENSFKTNGGIEAIVGIGLNVNQTDFAGLPQASSLYLVSGRTSDPDQLAAAIATAVRNRLGQLEQAWHKYLDLLFRKNLPTAFRDAQGSEFMGLVNTVTSDGRLEIQLEDQSVRTFGIKEIRMLY